MEENPYQPPKDGEPVPQPPRPNHDRGMLIVLLVILGVIGLACGWIMFNSPIEH